MNFFGERVSKASYGHSNCADCGKHDYLRPLHGDKGGPRLCLTCIGKWHGEHGRKRKLGRIVVRAIAAYREAGGSDDDLDKLKLSGGFLHLDPLGYETIVAHDDTVELTSELLADAIKLTHPDKHPPERRELAHRVTAGLVALQPFVFPAVVKPKPEPASPTLAEDTEEFFTTGSGAKLIEPAYPCKDCRDTFSDFYCDTCKAEYDRREQQDFERRTAKQRAQYAERRQRLVAQRPPAICVVCGVKFKSKRADAHYCSARCRQQAHRKPVTDKNSIQGVTLINRDKLERAILALLDRHRAVYLNDLLPEGRSSAQYQAVALAAARLEAEGKIDTWYFMCRYAKPGHKVLLKLGHRFEGGDQVPLLSDAERLRISQPGQGSTGNGRRQRDSA